MSNHSILVATDLSIEERGAVQRAEQLARERNATLKIMYFPPHGQGPNPLAATRLSAARRYAEKELQLLVATVPIEAHTLEDVVVEAGSVDLVVLPYRRERSIAAFFTGQSATRLARQCSCPILVTRGSLRKRYERILVPTDFSSESLAVARVAADFQSDAKLEIFHAISTRDEGKLRSAEVTEQVLLAYRRRCLERAHEQMLEFTRTLAAPEPRMFVKLSRGDSGRQTVIQQERSQADLVVVGTRRRSVWRDFLVGSTACRILSWGSSDVLLVPAPEKGHARVPLQSKRMAEANGPVLGLGSMEGSAS